jgi:hypothetical protein
MHWTGESCIYIFLILFETEWDGNGKKGTIRQCKFLVLLQRTINIKKKVNHKKNIA